MCKNNTYILVVLLLLHSSYSYAFESINQINNNHFENLDTLLVKAKVLVDNLEYKKAIVLYKEALLQAKKTESKSDIGLVYKKMGLVFFKQKNIKRSIFFFNKCIEVDLKTQNSADSHFNIALLYRKLKQRDSTLYHIDKSIEIYNNLKNSDGKYNTYKKAGILYNEYGKYDKAIELLLYALIYYQDKNDLKSVASVSKKIGIAQRLIGNLEKAKKYYLINLELNTNLKDTVETANALNSIANILKSQKKYDSAITYYKNAILHKQKVKNLFELGRIWNNLATVYYLKGDLGKALSTYKKALFQKKIEKDSASFSYTYNELSMIFIEKKQFIKAKKYIDSSLIYLSNISSKDVHLRSIEVQSVYYKSIKEYRISLELREKHEKLFQKIYNEKQSKLIQTLQEEFESKIKQKKIIDLSTRLESNEQTIVNQKETITQKNWVLVLFGLLILGLYIYFRQNEIIKEKQNEVKILNSIFENQEIIQESIGRDLHDIVSSNYNGIRLKILSIPQGGNVKEKCNEIADELKYINKEIRLVSHRLSPLGNKIQETSLTSIINSHLIEMQYLNKIFIDTQNEFLDELNYMSLKSQTHFYGILVELLNNITKHSLATKVIIENNIDENFNYFLSIKDNGKGFEKNKTDGIGLINIRQRTFLLNGDFTIETSDAGTKIKLRFPIKINTDGTEQTGIDN